MTSTPSSANQATHSTPAAPPGTLGYAPARPRRRYHRWLVVVVLLATAGFAAWRWGGEAWHRARVLYYQRQCARYAPPADQVVFDSHPQRAARLEDDAAYVVLRPSGGVTEALRNPPEAWVELCRLEGWNPLMMSGAGVELFLHERRNSKGERRIVVLEYDPHSWTPLLARVVTPGGFRDPPKLPPGPAHMSALLLTASSGPPHLRLFAGQPDPADESRFTIRFDRGGKIGTIYGQLKDDDGVTVEAPDVWVPFE